MVRMSNPSDRVRLSAHAADSRPSRSWSGAGGRWVLWPLRAVLWAAILIVAYRGLIAIVSDETSSNQDNGTVAASATAQFPSSLAEAYTLAFGQAYLNFSPQTQVQRQQQLAAFISPALAAASPDLGWNGSGELHLDTEQIAGINVLDAQHAVVDLLASVNGVLMQLGVPVFASGQGVVVSGEPAWLGAPAQVSPPAQGQVASDPVAEAQLADQMPAFFQAYANGSANALDRFLAPGASVEGLGGAVNFGGITDLIVPRGGSTREITVTVAWQVLGQNGVTAAKLNMTYGVSVVDLQSGKWYVKGISAATEAVGGQ
jgi:hypothetical protein